MKEAKLTKTFPFTMFIGMSFAELGASLFEIAQSLFALERTFSLGAMALSKKKSEER